MKKLLPSKKLLHWKPLKTYGAMLIWENSVCHSHGEHDRKKSYASVICPASSTMPSE